MAIFKLSYYIIVTDFLNDQFNRIIFSTRTSKAFLISDEILALLTSNNFDKIGSATLDKLVKSKILVHQNENELETIINENKESIELSDIMHEVIQPTAMCQLGCKYCGQSHKKTYLNKEYFDKILSRFRKKIKNRNYKILKIGWFGGEPLMAITQITEMTRIFKEFAKENNMTYEANIVTNGLALKEETFLNLMKLNITNIEITLDGTARYHDKRRYTKAKDETFGVIFNNMQNIFSRSDFASFACKFSIRCNVDRRNVSGVLPLIKLLHKNNIHQKISTFYPIGVYSWGNNAQEKSLTKEDFANLEIKWIIEMINRNFPISLLPERVKQVCMAVSPSSEIIDAYGNVFNCTEVPYVEKYQSTAYLLGNIKDEVNISGNRSFSDWNDSILVDKFDCHSCKMLPVCGGGCPKSWSEGMRACPPSKFNMSDKLRLLYEINNKLMSDEEIIEIA